MYGSEDQLGSYGETEDWGELTSQDEPSTSALTSKNNTTDAESSDKLNGIDIQVIRCAEYLNNSVPITLRTAQISSRNHRDD